MGSVQFNLNLPRDTPNWPIVGGFQGEGIRLARAFANIATRYNDPSGLVSDAEIPAVHSQPNIETLKNLGAMSGMDFSVAEILSFWRGAMPEIPLYDFQKRGVDWLGETSRAILADDMGLGKTVQAIAAVANGLWLNQLSSILVVAPRSLVFNWYAEFRRWTPRLTVSLVLPVGPGAKSTWNRRLGKSSVTITSYEQVRENADVISGNFDLVVADEAHRLRNQSSALSRAFARLASERLWLLTGTPLERDVEDLLRLLSLLHPGRFSASDKGKDPALLRSMAAPSVLRRRKDEVLADLPKSTGAHEYIQLSDLQQSEYSQTVRGSRGQNPLERFGRLRSICDLASDGRTSSKVDRVVELLQEIVALGESAVIFSFWKGASDALWNRLQSNQITECFYYNADLDLHARNAMVQAFQERGGLFVASGHIASEGLTLTRANHVLFLNRWWNPSLNRQAADRILRIGQTKPTFQYTFTAPGTIEIALDKMLEAKREDETAFVELLAESFSEADTP